MNPDLELRKGNDLPAAFDPQVYRQTNPDLRKLRDAELEQHYRDIGQNEGRSSSVITGLGAFFALLKGDASILEIGPLASPAVTGPHVKYFDVVGDDALREKARANGLDPAGCPHIDFVSATGDLAVVGEIFDAVVSSHAIEHQPDLLAHLAGVARLLNPLGRYFLAIPDKRYCFDHFIAESTIADVLDAHLAGRRLHSAARVIAHMTLATHNDAARHWRGDHGEPAWRADAAIVRQALHHVAHNEGRYIDTHAWQFTPQSFREIMQIISDIKLSPFRLLRVYPTLRGALEFYAVLEKAGDVIEPIAEGLPPDFDAQAYLEANPDVAQAGADAVQHYLHFGRREGRRLKI